MRWFILGSPRRSGKKSHNGYRDYRSGVKAKEGDVVFQEDYNFGNWFMLIVVTFVHIGILPNSTHICLPESNVYVSAYCDNKDS